MHRFYLDVFDSMFSTDHSMLLLLTCEQAGRQVIDIRAMLNDVTRLGHVDDSGEVSVRLSLVNVWRTSRGPDLQNILG